MTTARTRTTALPFRAKLAAVSAFAVLVTLAATMIPVYRQQRAALVTAQGDRLIAIASSTAAVLRADSLDRIATSPDQNVAAVGRSEGARVTPHR